MTHHRHRVPIDPAALLGGLAIVTTIIIWPTKPWTWLLAFIGALVYMHLHRRHKAHPKRHYKPRR